MSAPSSQGLGYLIVGQGVAGTLLAHFLLAADQQVRVIDQRLPGASSGIAAGIINPITGRRMVKTWLFEKLMPVARQTYADLEAQLAHPFFLDKKILRALPTVFDENEWQRRSAFPENKTYFSEPENLGGYENIIAPKHAWGELNHAAKVDLPALTAAFRVFLSENGWLKEERFDFGKLTFKENMVSYDGHRYRNIIFCEGARATSNPFFNYLPHAPTKGELLLVKIPGLKADKMLKSQLYIVPLRDGLFWVGASNAFDFQDVMPSDEKRGYLESALSEMVEAPVEIVEHQAGIRPTIADKRPLLGLHPTHPQLAIFNGLGTKGASLGPFFARQMAGFLLGQNGLDQEVDIARFGVA